MIFTPSSSSKQRITKTEATDDYSESESSTVSVGFASLPKRTKAPRRRPKTVLFDESRNVVHEPIHQHHHHLDDDSSPVGSTWYTPYDLQNNRTLHLHALQRFQRDWALGMVSTKTVIESTYEACLGMLYDDIDVLCPAETARLRYALQGVAPGLVSYASPALRQDVRQRRAKLVRVVQWMQQQENNQHNVAVDERAEYLSQLTQDISRPSRLFAQLVAQNYY